MLNRPAIMGTNSDADEAKLLALIDRANELATSLGYPEDTIKHEKIELGKKKKGGGLPPGFRAPGSNATH